MSNPQISADGTEIVLPFWCVPPGKTATEARAIKLDVASGAWSAIPFDSEALHRIENTRGEPAIPSDPSTRKSCATDCSRYAYRRRVDPKNPRYFFEIFFVENGQERQLTNFHVQGDPLGLPVLSKDGRHIAAIFAGKLALVEVSDGRVSQVEYRRPVGNVCVTGRV